MNEIISTICIISIPLSVIIWGICHLYYTRFPFMDYKKSDKIAIIISIIELYLLILGAIMIKLNGINSLK